jgi:hypothetical protein
MTKKAGSYGKAPDLYSGGDISNPGRVLSILTEVFSDFPPSLHVKAGVYLKSGNGAYFYALPSSLVASCPAN